MSDFRKATDVLLAVEQKLDILIELIRNKDLNDKIISNKLNNLINMISQEKSNSSPVFSAEAVVQTIQPQVPIIKHVSAEDSLPLENMPSSNGFSRTSRPETFAGDNSYLKKPSKKETSTKMPIQIPKGGHVEIVVPQQAVDLNKPSEVVTLPQSQYQDRPSAAVSVVQRVTDKNGKSLFLADVEVINKEDLQVVQKLKTNATGKWMCSLPVGEYSVIIKKRDPITKQIIEVGQNIQVNGLSNPLELPMAIIKG